jgi:hypothetical protein
MLRLVRLAVSLVVALAFTGVELLVVTGIALLFSAIAHPIEGAIFAFVATLAQFHLAALLRHHGAG